MIISEKVAERIRDALSAHGFTPAQGCWPVCAFGWIESHLDPGGCCGISRVLYATPEEVHVAIGGHAFCQLPERWPMTAKLASPARRALVEGVERILFESGQQVDYQRGHWTMRVDRELVMPVHIYGWPDWETTAGDIITVAKVALTPFHEACLAVHSRITALVEELQPTPDIEQEATSD